jgi:hypothetical protein
MPPQIPPRLARAVRGRKCILFAGSGLSCAAGYPSWGEMVLRLVDEARQIPGAKVQGLDELVEKKDWFSLAEFARTTLTPFDFGEVLKEMFFETGQPSRAHEMIARTDFRGIITTNFDRLLEIHITRVRNSMPTIFTTRGIGAMAVALFTSELFVYKMHGDVGEAHSIVLTASDYDEMILFSPHTRSFLHGAMLNYTLLFVGYSLSDPDFQLVLRELSLMFQNRVPKHYALIPNCGDFAKEHLLRRLNVQAIGYDPADGHREAVDVLEELQAIAPFPARVLAAAS